MNLQFKSDWEDAKQRYKAWWAHEAVGRCAVSVSAPLADAPPDPRPVRPSDPEILWTDLEYWARRKEWDFRRTFYGGESFPVWDCGYPGREGIGAFLGCPVKLGPDTGWVDPILHEEDLDVSGLRIEPDNRWWKFTLRLLEFGVERFKGKAIPSIGAFGGCGDTLAWLRGSERLLYDCVERPEQVREAELRLMDMWIEVYRRFHSIIGEAAEGSTCWFPLWSPGRFYATQNDFAYMIGPRMFRDLFVPALEKQTNFLDHAVHHVDGEGNFAHVDALLEMPGIQAIQILPGAGKPSPLHYMPLLKKVQAAGRNLHIGLEPGEVEEALSRLSARGLFIATRCTTEQEARALLKNAEKWSKDRKV